MVVFDNQKAQPCLPSDYDRFADPLPRTVGPKPRNSTPQFSATVNTSNNKIHPEGSNLWFSGCVVSNKPVEQPLDALGNSLLEKAKLESSDRHATVFVMSVGPCIRYYIVNHLTKVAMWADCDGIPNAVSAVEPKRAHNILHEQYWVHMENFPAPIPATAEDLQELKVVLASYAIDSSTSDGSTSPFSSAQICEFLTVLNTLSGEIEMFQTYTIARLWSMIWHARVVNSFGTTGACLDRFTGLPENPPVFHGPCAFWARLFVGTGADAHLTRCSRVWAGRVAYVTEWRNFKSKNELEWNQIMYLACVLMIVSLLVRGQSTIRFISNITVNRQPTRRGTFNVGKQYRMASKASHFGTLHQAHCSYGDF
ncbi:hypothetical protein FRC07_005045 [Ceratobasidium sp. 392]|nr:hypothetical protein FRC07_005045 [Ceratobasidium sp. 392]